MPDLKPSKFCLVTSMFWFLSALLNIYVFFLGLGYFIMGSVGDVGDKPNIPTSVEVVLGCTNN